MKVIGQLERAQLECSTPGTIAGGTPIGRVYADITSTTGAVPRFYNGSAWVPLLTGVSSATGVVSQNSGSSVTVNWSNGLAQQVVLTGHCVISFLNPQPGQVHTLIITQAALEAGSITPWQYKLNMVDQDSRRLPYQPISVLQSSESAFFAWLYVAGVKPAYATIPSPAGAPAALPSTLITGLDIHPKLNMVAGGRTSSPFSVNYQFYDAGNTFMWGNKDVVAAPAAAAQAVGLSYHPDGHSVFMASGTSPFIQGWLLDVNGIPISGGVYANPGTLPAGAATSINVHPSGTHVGVGHATTPFMSIYPLTSGAFGTKVTNPASLPAAQVNALAWSPQGDYLAVASQTTPFIQVWPFDVNTGFGTIVSNPGGLPAGGPAGSLGRAIAWRPQGDFIAMAMTTSPFLYVVAFNRATGAFGVSAFGGGPFAPAAALTSVAWSPDGQFLIGGSTGGTFMYIWNFGAGTTANVTPLAYTGANPGQQVNDIAVHSSGEYAILALNASPFIKTYPLPRAVKNYLKLTE